MKEKWVPMAFSDLFHICFCVLHFSEWSRRPFHQWIRPAFSIGSLPAEQGGKTLPQ